MSLESSYLVLTGKGQGRFSGRGGNLSRDLKDKVKMQKGKSVLDKRDSIYNGQSLEEPGCLETTLQGSSKVSA